MAGVKPLALLLKQFLKMANYIGMLKTANIVGCIVFITVHSLT